MNVQLHLCPITRHKYVLKACKQSCIHFRSRRQVEGKEFKLQPRHPCSKVPGIQCRGRPQSRCVRGGEEKKSTSETRTKLRCSASHVTLTLSRKTFRLLISPSKQIRKLTTSSSRFIIKNYHPTRGGVFMLNLLCRLTPRKRKMKFVTYFRS
jgi:hypothetical protein